MSTSGPIKCTSSQWLDSIKQLPGIWLIISVTENNNALVRNLIFLSKTI